MQVSEKSKQTFDACRFCWMCHHICPIGNATGHERNTARARALSLSLVERGGLPLDEEVASNLYECALCSGCAHDCITGWDPTAFTKEARLAAVLEGVLPPYITALLDRLADDGTPYGKLPHDAALDAAIAALPAKADVLLYLGADARALYPAGALNAIRLLTAAGVSFTVLKDEPDDAYGWAFLTGASQESRAAMRRANEAFAPFRTVVCYDGTDAAAFLRDGKAWGEITADVRSFPAYVASLIESGKLTVKKTGTAYTVQDCAYIARELDDDRSIRVIADALGTRREMLLCGKATMLGGQSLMSAYMPEVMRAVAARRMHEAIEAGATVLLTENVGEYLALSAVAPETVKVITIEEALLSC